VSKKLVLIVDDSPVAQMHLKKMLSRYELTVEVVFSGEEAVNYLRHTAPAVIFMDHTMKGMDGFQTLKLIKDNPDTALVPIIMYTAQEGEVYTSQARALGAFDVISKQAIQPSDLHRVLQLLHIERKKIPAPDSPAAAVSPPTAEPQPPQPEPAPPAATPEPSPQLTTGKVPPQNDEKLKDARLNSRLQSLSQDIEEHTHVLTARLTGQLQRLRHSLKKDLHESLSKAQQQQPQDDPEHSAPAAAPAPAESTGGLSSGLVILVLLVGGFFLWQQQQHTVDTLKASQQALQTQLADIAQQLQQTETRLAERPQAAPPTAARNPRSSQQSVMLKAYSISSRISGPLAFGEPLLSGSKLDDFRELITLLDEVNFTGKVRLNIYTGNFCVSSNIYGDWNLLEHNAPIDQCEFFAIKMRDFTDANPVSNAFANLLSGGPKSSIANESLLSRIEITPHGTEASQAEYPKIKQGLSAGEWNEAASLNNRLIVELIRQP
jgi:CheY-like chemotaxis protein